MSDSIQRNPHPDFAKVEASRPVWQPKTPEFFKTPNTNWKFGHGRNDVPDEGKDNNHIAIDPYQEGRANALNYKLLISAVTPRPIAFLSTRSADGKSTNLAPFSYFNMMNHDPPIFVIGFASSIENAKDSLRNLLDTKECVINIISETFIEAANSTSIDAPYGASEWDVSGLTPDYSCETVKCARVKEAVVSIEGVLESTREWESRATPGKKTGTMVMIEGTRFWVREDALDKDKSLVDPAILRPISRLGGITYANTPQLMELPRPKFDSDLGGLEGLEKLKGSKK